MAVMHYVDVKCPACGRAFEWRVLGLCSGLGPPRIQCAKCDHVLATDRMEWQVMSTARRTKFLVATAIYLAGIGWFGGLGVRAFVHFLEDGPWDGKLDPGAPGFLEGAIAWGLLVVGIQLYRVLESQRRTRSAAEAPAINSFTSLHYELQLKFLAGPFLIGGIGWLLALVVHSAR